MHRLALVGGYLVSILYLSFIMIYFLDKGKDTLANDKKNL